MRLAKFLILFSLLSIQADFAAAISRVTITGKRPNRSVVPLHDVSKDKHVPPVIRERGERTPLQAKPPSVDNSNKEDDKECKSTENPVVIATGEKHKDEPDFQSVGLYGLSLTRTYRSQHASGKLFGKHWPSSLDPASLRYSACFVPSPGWHCVPSTITYTDETGAAFVYNYKEAGPLAGTEKNPGDAVSATATGRPTNYIYAAGSNAAMGELTYQLNGSAIVQRDKMAYHFNSRRNLSSVTDLSSTALRRYAYVTDGAGMPRLDSISNRAGQTVKLTWGQWGVASVQDSASNV